MQRNEAGHLVHCLFNPLTLFCPPFCHYLSPENDSQHREQESLELFSLPKNQKNFCSHLTIRQMKTRTKSSLLKAPSKVATKLRKQKMGKRKKNTHMLSMNSESTNQKIKSKYLEQKCRTQQSRRLEGGGEGSLKRKGSKVGALRRKYKAAWHLQITRGYL